MLANTFKSVFVSDVLLRTFSVFCAFFCAYIDNVFALDSDNMPGFGQYVG